MIPVQISKSEAIIHLLGLSPEERYSRFCFPANDEYIINYVNKAKGFFYGYYNLETPIDFIKPSVKCSALLHFVYYKQDNSIEVAVSVLADYRGRGLAKALLSFGAKLAESYPVNKLYVTGLSSNSPMVSLAKSCGFELKNEYGEFEGIRETIGSDIREIVGNQLKLFEIFYKKENK